MICSSWPSQRARSERIHQTRKKQRRNRTRLHHESSFICGTVKRPVGSISNNAAIAKTRVLKRISKNDTALHKHMKWLKELQEDLRTANESKRHEEQQRMKRRSDFMERESKKRLIKRAAKEEALREAGDGENPQNPPPTHPCETNSSSLAADESSSMKPAWCQSKEAADTAQEMAEMAEEFDLLDFVHHLDFDSYEKDVELQVLLGQVKDRIKKLQREKKKDETKLQTCVDSENAAARAEQLDNHQVVVDFVPSNIETNEEHHVDDVKSIIAETVMTESTIRSIHSRKSLTTLVNKARERIIGMDTIEEGTTPQPNQSSIINNEGQRKKIDVNKLPFMNRNPAI